MGNYLVSEVQLTGVQPGRFMPDNDPLTPQVAAQGALAWEDSDPYVQAAAQLVIKHRQQRGSDERHQSNLMRDGVLRSLKAYERVQDAVIAGIQAEVTALQAQGGQPAQPVDLSGQTGPGVTGTISTANLPMPDIEAYVQMNYAVPYAAIEAAVQAAYVVPTIPLATGVSGVLPAACLPQVPLANLPAIPLGTGVSGVLPLANLPAIPLATGVSGVLPLACVPSIPLATGVTGTLPASCLPAVPLANLPVIPLATGVSGVLPAACLPSIPLANLPTIPLSTGVSGTLPTSCLPQIPLANLPQPGEATVANADASYAESAANQQWSRVTYNGAITAARTITWAQPASAAGYCERTIKNACTFPLLIACGAATVAVAPGVSQRVAFSSTTGATALGAAFA